MSKQATRRKNKIANVIPPIVIRMPGASQAADSWAWRAPCRGRAMSAYEKHGTASTSGTLMLRKSRTDGVAVSAGTAMFASAMSIAGAADTELAATLASALADREFAEGEWLGIDTGGTLTNLAGACLIVNWEPID